MQLGIERYRVPELLMDPAPKNDFDVGAASGATLKSLPSMLLDWCVYKRVISGVFPSLVLLILSLASDLFFCTLISPVYTWNV